MAKTATVEQQLAALAAVRADPHAAGAAEVLRKALASRSSIVAGKAGRIIGAGEVRGLDDDLAKAFERFMAGPAARDKGCQAKSPIVEALYLLGSDRDDVFIPAIAHVQMEPRYGGPEDTAAALRGFAALGLVRMNHPAAMNHLAALLADGETDARIMAARAIAYSKLDAGAPLLRFKALTGDASAEVLGECFLALLRLAPEESVDFVRGFVQSGAPGVGEAALLAISEAKAPGALEILRDLWRSATEPGLSQTALLGIAMLRCEEALELLLSILSDEPAGDAIDAAIALRSYVRDPAVRERMERIAARRREPGLRRAITETLEVRQP